MDKTKFGSFIKEKRTEKGYTQKELADILMLDVTAVSKWERGVTYPDITLIPDICKALDVSEHELVESSSDTEYRAIKSEAEKFRKIKDTVFYVTSGAYFITVLTCFSVNLAVEKTLSWFFIVLASCVCGFTFLPTVTRFFQRYKLTAFLISSFSGLFILYLTCSIYTKNYWFPIAASGTLLGYFCIFYPIIFSKQKAYLSEEKYKNLKRFFFITYSVGIWFLTTLLLFAVNFYKPINLDIAFIITAYCFTLPVLIGLTLMARIGAFFKTAASFVFATPYLYGLNFVLSSLLGNSNVNSCHIDFNNWKDYTNGNTFFIFATVCILLAILFFTVGIIRKCRKK